MSIRSMSSRALLLLPPLLLLCGTVPSARAQCPLSFAAASNYAAGTQPYSVAVGDFNADGRLDLAVSNFDSGNVSILLGNVSGTFQGAVNYAVGSFPISVAVGDFNADGRPDLAVANALSNNVSILRGNASGTFQAAVNYAAGSSPRSVAVGDFNADGRLDLAVVNSFNGVGGNNVSILLGNVSGTFQPAVNYAVGISPLSVAVGDFNADGRPDLAVSNFDSDNVSILLGNVSGTFQRAVNYAVGISPLSVAVGDFNADGRPDLAVSNFDSGNVSILLGNVSGTFQPAVNYAVGTSPLSVAVGDFNADGRPDLAVANGFSDNVSVRLNGPIIQQPVSRSICPASVATFSVTVAGTATAYQWQWQPAGPNTAWAALANGSNNNSQATPTFNVSGATTPTMSIVSISGLGGNLRCMVTTTCGSVASNAVVLTVLGAWDLAVNYAAGTQPQSVATGDFNADGRPDVAVANFNSNNVSILLGNLSGTFLPAVNYAAGTGPNSIAVGDFNADGRPDLAVTNMNGSNVSILLGNAPPNAGTFQAAVNYAAGASPRSVAVGDFNADGRPDLAVANLFSDNVSILLASSAGGGTFLPPVNFVAGSRPISVAVGDFNADGRPDLAVANGFSDNVSILLRSGGAGGTFLPAVNYAVGPSQQFVAVGDFNADGRPDLAVVNNNLQGAGTVSILLGNLSGTFQAAVNYAVGSGPRSVAVGDFNADGRPDLAVANHTSNNVSILLGTLFGAFQAVAVNYVVGSNPHSVAVGDFNADGRPDLAVANSGSNNVSMVLNTTPTAPTIAPTGQPLPQSILSGQTLVLSANVRAGVDGVSVQWRRNGVSIVNGPGGASPGGGAVSGASGPLPSPTNGTPTTLTITSTQASDIGAFTAMFTNFCGSVTSVPATVTLIPPCSSSDLAGPGLSPGHDGELTADDIILFISRFIAGNVLSDIAGPGPSVGADGELTADDIILFISRFTAGC